MGGRVADRLPRRFVLQRQVVDLGERREERGVGGPGRRGGVGHDGLETDVHGRVVGCGGGGGGYRRRGIGRAHGQSASGGAVRPGMSLLQSLLDEAHERLVALHGASVRCLVYRLGVKGHDAMEDVVQQSAVATRAAAASGRVQQGGTVEERRVVSLDGASRGDGLGRRCREGEFGRRRRSTAAAVRHEQKHGQRPVHLGDGVRRRVLLDRGIHDGFQSLRNLLLLDEIDDYRFEQSFASDGTTVAVPLPPNERRGEVRRRRRRHDQRTQTEAKFAVLGIVLRERFGQVIQPPVVSALLPGGFGASGELHPRQ
mmetsp:Transcript_21206/g.44794  ORF Transcript_21206/g.44794 Transcript_21206/m.44794 type:complete len:313 (-) Transcript_21206:352-1290(-)